MTIDGESTALLDMRALDAAALRALSNQAIESDFSPRHLAPAMEWNWLRNTRTELPALSYNDGVVDQTLSEIDRGTESWISARGTAGVLRTRRDHSDVNRSDWVTFRQAFESAASASGLGPAAKGLTGALNELEDNIHLHSGLPGSGLIAFRRGNRQFECVLCDEGMGILTSLRTSPQHVALRDEGEALERVVKEGASRLPSTNKHGWGFRSLHTGILNLHSRLRFHSGDHVLEMNQLRGAAPTARLFRHLSTSGFLISIQCEPAT